MTRAAEQTRYAGVLPSLRDKPRPEPHYGWIAAGIALVILYGSFYPFRFYLHHDPHHGHHGHLGPLGVLLRSGFRPSSRDDVIANILLYIPLGLFAGYAIKRRTLTTIAAATAAGFALSLLVELTQFYFAGRFQELTDLCANTVGTLLGAAAAVAARRRMVSPYLALILTCWLGSRWYPALPLPAPSPLDGFGFFAAWLAVGLILEAMCGAPRSRVVLPGLLAVSLLVRTLTVAFDPVEIAVGVAAALLWSGVLWRLRSRAVIAAALLVALVVLGALVPFHFSYPARGFGWVPFRSFLEAGTETAIRSFFEKAFLYGGMLWLLVRAGFSAAASAAFGAALVLNLRLLQVYLPGRSAEITDMVLVLMLAAMMRLGSPPQPLDS